MLVVLLAHWIEFLLKTLHTFRRHFDLNYVGARVCFFCGAKFENNQSVRGSISRKVTINPSDLRVSPIGSWKAGIYAVIDSLCCTLRKTLRSAQKDLSCDVCI